jgi:hypothetical protein
MLLKQLKFLPWDLCYSDLRENGCFCKVQYFPKVRCICSKLFINRFKNGIDLSAYLCERHWKMVSVSLHEQLSSHWMEFCEILYWGFLWKCVKQIEVMLKSDKLQTLYMKSCILLCHWSKSWRQTVFSVRYELRPEKRQCKHNNWAWLTH